MQGPERGQQRGQQQHSSSWFSYSSSSVYVSGEGATGTLWSDCGLLHGSAVCSSWLAVSIASHVPATELYPTLPDREAQISAQCVDHHKVHLGAESNVYLVLQWKTLMWTPNVLGQFMFPNHNGMLYTYIFLHHPRNLPWCNGKQVHLINPLISYIVMKPKEIHLAGESATPQVEDESNTKCGGKWHCFWWVLSFCSCAWIG